MIARYFRRGLRIGHASGLTIGITEGLIIVVGLFFLGLFALPDPKTPPPYCPSENGICENNPAPPLSDIP